MRTPTSKSSCRDIDRQMQQAGLLDQPRPKRPDPAATPRSRAAHSDPDPPARRRRGARHLARAAGGGRGRSTRSASFLDRLEEELTQLEMQLKLSGEHDDKNAIVAIHPGAGGTESQDWAEMLLRMYLRWAEQHGYDGRDARPPGRRRGGDQERHLRRARRLRLRLPEEPSTACTAWCASRPFDSSEAAPHLVRLGLRLSRRSTTPIEIEINDKDLRVDTYRSSGAGGQHVNMTDSAIRITHMPDRHRRHLPERAQPAQEPRDGDEAPALPPLRPRDGEAAGGAGEARREEEGIGCGSQIRSYVLQPYQMVKDHRTGVEVGDADTRPRRRPRSVHRGVSQGADGGRRDKDDLAI